MHIFSLVLILFKIEIFNKVKYQPNDIRTIFKSDSIKKKICKWYTKTAFIRLK